MNWVLYQTTSPDHAVNWRHLKKHPSVRAVRQIDATTLEILHHNHSDPFENPPLLFQGTEKEPLMVERRR